MHLRCLPCIFKCSPRNYQTVTPWDLSIPDIYYGCSNAAKLSWNKNIFLTLSWRRPLSYRNQWTGFYMITASVMKGLRKKLVFSLLTVLSVLDLFLLQILKVSVSSGLQASCLSSNYYINFFLHMIIRINFSVWLITHT